jgi:hypothetical protein
MKGGKSKKSATISTFPGKMPTFIYRSRMGICGEDDFRYRIEKAALSSGENVGNF